MALHKLNVLHWHLTDDQALAPRDQEVSEADRSRRVARARRARGGCGHRSGDRTSRGSYGGFYTQDQVREIVAYAAARHITIVPEIEMPGHASAAIAAYPRARRHRQAVAAVPADWGVYQNLFNVEESTFAFLEDVLAEVMELFPSEYIHVGGDEAVKDQWQRSPRVQSADARARREGRACAAELFHAADRRSISNAHGRRLIGWDEILEGGLAPNATVMSWRGIDGAIAAAAAGHDAVLSPAPTLYFDNRPLELRRVRRARPGRERRRRVSLRSGAGRADRSAAQAHPRRAGEPVDRAHPHRGSRRVHDLSARRGASRKSAGRRPSASTGNRSRRACRLSSRAIARSASASRERPRPVCRRALDVAPATSSRRAAQKILLSLEDDAPVQGERAVFLVDIMNPCWIYRGADLSAGRGDRGVGRPGAVQFPDRRRREEDSVAQAADRGRRAGGAHRRLRRREDRHAAARAGCEELRSDRACRRRRSRSRTGQHDLCFTLHAGHASIRCGCSMPCSRRPCRRRAALILRPCSDR